MTQPFSRLAAIVIALTGVAWLVYAVGVWFGLEVQTLLISVACLLSGTRILGWSVELWKGKP